MEKILYTKYLWRNSDNSISVSPKKTDFKKNYSRTNITIDKDLIVLNGITLYKVKSLEDELFQFDSFYYNSKQVKDVYINYIDKFIYLIIYIDNSYQLIESSSYSLIDTVKIGILYDNSVVYNMFNYIKSFY